MTVDENLVECAATIIADKQCGGPSLTDRPMRNDGALHAGVPVCFGTIGFHIMRAALP